MQRTAILLLLFLSNLAIGQMPDDLTKAEKVFGLSQFWQEVNYSFIYFDQVNQKKWNELYISYIDKVQQTSNDYEYYRLLQKFCAYLKDGHTNVWPPKSIRDSIFNGHFGNYRMELKNIEGRAIVARINKNKSKEIPIGSEIVAINGMETAAYIRKNRIPYISSSTDYVRQDLAVEYLLEAYAGTRYRLKLKLPTGTIKELDLTVAASGDTEFEPPLKKRPKVELEWRGNDIAHLSLNTFYDWETLTGFQELLPEIRKAKAMIIDLRNNGGGNSGVAKVVLHYLTNDTIFYGPRSQSRSHIAYEKAINRGEYYHSIPYRPDTLGIGDRNLLRDKRVVIPTAILIGHGTASAAEDFLIYADKQQHMTKIGEPTYGSTGMPLSIHLPNGGGARVCTKKDTYPDGRVFVGVGIQPDIMVTRSVSGFITNKDPVLERAILFLRDKL